MHGDDKAFQNEFMTSNTYFASKKRLFLAWYIDLLFFLTAWWLFTHLFGIGLNISEGIPTILFSILWFFARKHIGSFGYYFLAIDKNKNIVSPNIYENESWLTLLIGVLSILSGTKAIVRSIQTYIPFPYFGTIPDDNTQILIQNSMGILLILCGYWFLKLNIKGLYLGVSMVVINLFSLILSWTLWDPIIEKMVIARRQVQGLPIEPKRIEAMQAIFPEGFIFGILLIIIMMLLCLKRLKNYQKLSGLARRLG